VSRRNGITSEIRWYGAVYIRKGCQNSTAKTEVVQAVSRMRSEWLPVKVMHCSIIRTKNQGRQWKNG